VFHALCCRPNTSTSACPAHSSCTLRRNSKYRPTGGLVLRSHERMGACTVTLGPIGDHQLSPHATISVPACPSALSIGYNLCHAMVSLQLSCDWSVDMSVLLLACTRHAMQCAAAVCQPAAHAPRGAGACSLTQTDLQQSLARSSCRCSSSSSDRRRFQSRIQSSC
jgi:hypothetical protein